MKGADPKGANPKLERFFKSLDALAGSKGLALARRAIPRMAWLQTESDVVALLFTSFSQEDLHLAMHRGISALEEVQKDSSEWDIINEALDMIWLAIGGDEEDED